MSKTNITSVGAVDARALAVNDQETLSRHTMASVPAKVTSERRRRAPQPPDLGGRVLACKRRADAHARRACEVPAERLSGATCPVTTDLGTAQATEFFSDMLSAFLMFESAPGR